MYSRARKEALKAVLLGIGGICLLGLTNLSAIEGLRADELTGKKEEVFKFVSSGLGSKLRYLRINNSDYFPTWPKYPDTVPTRFVGNRPDYYNGLAFGYLNVVSITAGVSLVKNGGSGLIVVMDDRISDWVSVENLIKADPSSGDFSIPNQVKARPLRNCEYDTFSDGERNTNGFIVVNTTGGSVNSDLCLLKAAFSIFGFDPDPENEARHAADIDISDGLSVIKQIYSLPADKRRLSSFFPILFNELCKSLCK